MEVKTHYGKGHAEDKAELINFTKGKTYQQIYIYIYI